MASVTGRSTVTWVGGSLGVIVLAAISLFGVHIAQVTEQVDRQVFLRDVDALTQGVFLLGEFAAVEQVGLAERTEAYENISTRYNPVWVERNLGKEVFSDPDREEILLVADSGEILHSSNKVHGHPHRVETLRAARLIAIKARQVLDRAVTADTAGRIEMKLPVANALFDGVYTHAIAIVGDVTAIVAAAVVLPDRGNLLSRPEAPVVLVSVRPIRDEMLSALGKTTQLGDTRFGRRKSEAPNLWGHKLANQLGTGDSVLTSGNSASVNQVFAMWPRKNIGATAMATMVPGLVVMVSFLVFLALGTVITVRRMAGRVAQSQAVAAQRRAPGDIEAGSEREELATVDALKRKAEELRDVGRVASQGSAETAVNA